MFTGKIELIRQNTAFTAGFCIIKEPLSRLTTELSLLHIEEMSYYKTLQYDRRKLSYLLGKFSAKKAIKELFSFIDLSSIQIATGVFQFPVVKSPIRDNIQVSISHCDDLGISIAFPEEHPIGVDVEEINEDKIEAINSQLTSDEIKISSNLTPSLIGITGIWAMKESLSKVLKVGLMIDFKILEIESLVEEEGAYTSTFKNFPQYKGLFKVQKNHVLSIVLPKNTTPQLSSFWEEVSKI